MSEPTATIRLYDSTDHEFHDITFTTRASMYTCGVTPYDSSHLGHVATFIYFDVLRRHILSQGVDVVLVRNVTDLDDPLFERVRTSGESLDALVSRNMTQLTVDLEKLNCLPPTYEPYSRDYVDDMIVAISELIEAGHAYTVNGWTYFDTASREKFPEFDVLRELGENELEDMAASRGANPDDPSMRNRLDFVLWKPSLGDELAFDTPFGRGRPGWHIECSVMAMKLLGDTMDIHGGGDDLIFPHHACEVSQSESLSGHTYAKHFMHIAPVSYDGAKMSKSLGNLVYAADVIDEIGARCTRMMILSHHYREGFEHHNDDARAALNRCERWSRVLKDYSGGSQQGGISHAVRERLSDDLDTPGALRLIDEAVAHFDEGAHDADVVRADICAAKELLGL